MALQDWLGEVYREHAPALFRFLIRLTGDEAETKDIVQDIFIRLARSPQSLKGVTAPRSYLFRLAHNLVIDRRHREQTRLDYEHRLHEESATSCPPEAPGGDALWLRQTLNFSLQTLPPEQRAVVVLKVWEEMTFAEIAEALGISANTAASRYRYALDKMRDDLRPLQRDLP